MMPEVVGQNPHGKGVHDQMVCAHQEDVVAAGQSHEPRPKQPAPYQVERAVQIHLDLASEIVGPGQHLEPKMTRRIHNLSRLPVDHHDPRSKGRVALDDSLETLTQTLYIECPAEE